MDKSTYLKIKLERDQKINESRFAKEDFCYKCHRLQKLCLCHLIIPFDTQFRFVILMHPMEAKKEKIGTGRVCLAGLKNSQMIMGIDFTDDSEVNDLINDPNNACYTLYPGEKAINVSEGDVSLLKNQIDSKKNIIVFLIDGTWPCAKKMMKLSKNINSLPRVSFTPKNESIFEIKEQPADYCLSTLESIHFFIQECNRRELERTQNAEDNLIDVFKSMIKYQVECAVDPTKSNYRNRNGKGFSQKTERVKSKKWSMKVRNIILLDK